MLDILSRRGERIDQVREQIESDIRFANITIIEDIGASQYGIGAVVARLAEAVLRDEQALFTVAATYRDYQVTLSLLSVLGAGGVQQMYLFHIAFSQSFFSAAALSPTEWAVAGRNRLIRAVARGVAQADRPGTDHRQINLSIMILSRR